MIIKIFLRNMICYAMSILMAYMPASLSYADAITDSAAAGSSLGSSINGTRSIPTFNSSSDSFTLNGGTGDEEVLHLNDLFQDASGDVSDYTDSYGSESTLRSIGNSAQDNLLDSSSPSGNAYKAVLAGAQKTAPDLHDDPIWGATESSITNAELISEFSGCEISSEVGESNSITAHIPDYRSCERVVDASASCTIEHGYEAEFLRHVSGPTNISSCGTGCLDIWIGRVGDNYLSGNCTIHEQSLIFDVENPRAIISATLERAVWDDYMQVLINNDLVWRSHSNFPPETSGSCELATSWDRSLNVDVTSHLETAGRKTFKVRASVTGGGEAYGRMRIRYDPSKTMATDDWSPQSCVNAAQDAVTNSCPSTFTCLEGPETNGFSREVKFASVGQDWLTVQFDLTTGAWNTIAPYDGINAIGSVETISYNTACSIVADDRPDLVSATYWSGSGVGASLDTSVHTRVLEYPTCTNGLKGIVQIEDTTKKPSYKYDLSGKFVFKWAGLSKSAAGSDNCIRIGGELICKDFFKPSPVPGISPFCTKVAVESTCLQTQGPMDCFTDAHGERQCFSSLGTVESTCEELEEDPSCAFVESECVQGAMVGGVCRVFDDTYDCGYDTIVKDYDVTQEIECGAEIRCMGTECVDPAGSRSSSFNRVAATMQIAKMAQSDGDCSDTVFADCQVFKGEVLECKKAVGGMQDCCFAPTGMGWLQYVEMMHQTYRVDNLIMAQDSGSAIQGAWSELRTPIVDTWDSIQSAWTSSSETVAGATEGGLDLGIDAAMNEFKNEAMKYAYDFVGTVFDDAAANALFDVSGHGASQVVSFNPIVTNIMGSIMFVYAIYSVAKLILQLVFPCEEEEYELSAKKATKSCHRIGSYCKTKLLSGVCIEKRTSHCCFNSPLSRIVNEQTRLQGIGNWGTPRTPNCAGLTIPQLDSVDWDRVDLSEWIGMLNVADKLPDPTEFSVETLTGQGSVHDLSPGDNPRTDVIDRTTERMDSLDFEEITDNAEAGARAVIPVDPIPADE